MQPLHTLYSNILYWLPAWTIQYMEHFALPPYSSLILTPPSFIYSFFKFFFHILLRLKISILVIIYLKTYFLAELVLKNRQSVPIKFARSTPL